MRIGNFSASAASAVACRIARPDRILYADTGAEDPDNRRFIIDCERALFDVPVEIVRSERYADTWDVWQKRRYISGINGAPCSKFLKRLPLEGAVMPDDTILIGYTVDERARADALVERGGRYEFPLISAGLDHAACRALLDRWGIREPRAYRLGFEHANCVPCCKAVSGRYWQLVREHYPDEFARFAAEERAARIRGRRRGQVWWRGEYISLDDLPVEPAPATDGGVPACDFLCQLAEDA